MTDNGLVLRDLILQHVLDNGKSVGNKKLFSQLTKAADFSFKEADYWQVRDGLIEEGVLVAGKGRGGSVMLVGLDREGGDAPGKGAAEKEVNFLKAPERPQPKQASSQRVTEKAAGKKAKKKKGETNQVISYRHDDRRKNNPHVGMVDTVSDADDGIDSWAYDPHIDPALQFDVGRSQIENLIDDALASGDKEVMQQALEQLKRMQAPYLNWSGKAERTSFEVDTVSLHVHERIDPATILASLQKQLKGGKGKGSPFQMGLFSAPFENLPLREAIDFYKHERDWANRLITGDSLLVMNSLLQKESMAGQVQMIYIDPPYGIKYGSNFQPFVNNSPLKNHYLAKAVTH